MIDEQDLVAYLTSKGVQVFRAAGSEVSLQCLWCGETHTKGKMYANTASWLFTCFVCGESGNRRRLLEHFGDEDGLAYAEGADPNVRWRILKEAAELAHEMLLGSDDQIEYLLGRGLNDETIVARKFGFVPRNFGLVDSLPNRERYTRADLVNSGLLTVGGRDFFNYSITIPYWSHGSVVQIREKQIGGKYRTPAGDRTRLYNSDSLFGAEEVLITEGELDCAVAEQALKGSGDRRLESIAVVGVAGAGSWPDGFVESLSSLKRVFIGFDPDETGHRFAAKLKGEVGNAARIVGLPEGLPKTDWSDFLSEATPSNPNGGHNWRDVQDLLHEADLTGKRVLSVTDARLKWHKNQISAPGLKLGWASMDAVLRPGLKPGQVMIPLARTGTGKSVVLSNIAYNTRKAGVLYLSLEMTASEVFEHLRRIHRFWHPKGTPNDLLTDYERVYLVEQNRIRRGDLENYITEYEEATGRPPGLVIVDYLQYFGRGFNGATAYERVTDAIMELKAVAKEAGCPFIVPSQVNRTAEAGRPLSLDHARDGGTVEETGDFVISLFRPDQATDQDGNPLPSTGNFNAQFLKSRHGGVGKMSNLRFSPLSLAIVDTLDRVNAQRVEQEVALSRRGMHYADYERQLIEANAQDPIEGVGP